MRGLRPACRDEQDQKANMGKHEAHGEFFTQECALGDEFPVHAPAVLEDAAKVEGT